jgi:hypothetical protein
MCKCNAKKHSRSIVRVAVVLPHFSIISNGIVTTTFIEEVFEVEAISWNTIKSELMAIMFAEL